MLVKKCKESLHNLSAAEKTDTLLSIVKSCVAGIMHSIRHTATSLIYDAFLGTEDTDRLEMLWKIKTRSVLVRGVCRRAFANAYGIGTTKLARLCDEIKASALRSSLIEIKFCVEGRKFHGGVTLR